MSSSIRFFPLGACIIRMILGCYIGPVLAVQEIEYPSGSTVRGSSSLPKWVELVSPTAKMLIHSLTLRPLKGMHGISLW